jgi:hypothetical protein
MAELWGNCRLYLDILDTSLCFHCEVKWFGQVKNLRVDSLNLFDISSTFIIYWETNPETVPLTEKKSLEKGRDVEIVSSHWKRLTQIWRTSPLDLFHFDTGQSEKCQTETVGLGGWCSKDACLEEEWIAGDGDSTEPSLLRSVNIYSMQKNYWTKQFFEHFFDLILKIM